MREISIPASISVLIGVVLLWLFWMPLLTWLIAVGLDGTAAGLLSFVVLLLGPGVMLLALRARM